MFHFKNAVQRCINQLNLKKRKLENFSKFEKNFFATAHARGGLKFSFGTWYEKSAGAIKLST